MLTYGALRPAEGLLEWRARSVLIFRTGTAARARWSWAACGALDVAPRKFFLTLAGARVVRFGGEALALFYGDVIASWLESGTVRTIAGVLFGLVIAGAVFSSYRLIRSTAGRRKPRSVRA